MNSSKSPYFIMQAAKPKRKATKAVLETPTKLTVKQEPFDANIIKSEPLDIENLVQSIKPEIADFKIKQELCDLPPVNESATWYPNNWECLYGNIRKMREDRTAPVDTMGCDRCNDIDASPKVQR